jgi:hypothetical protein
MQHRTRKIIAAIGISAMVAAVGFDIHLSLDPDKYFYYVPEDRADWQYDLTSVAFVVAAMLAAGSASLAALVSSRPRALWLRCLIGLALLVPWGLFSAMFVMHMPGYEIVHIIWIWSLIALLSVVGVFSLIRQAYFRLSGRPPNQSFKPTSLRDAA